MNYFHHVDQDPGAWGVPPVFGPGSPPPIDKLREARGVVLGVAMGAGVWLLVPVFCRLVMALRDVCAWLGWV